MAEIVELPEKLESCMSEVSQRIKAFLVQEGGHSNGYYTYVRGEVKANLPSELTWSTPTASEELTAKGRENRAKDLYLELQEILKKYNVNHLLIRSRDEGYGEMKTEVVYVVEKAKTVNLW